MQIIVDIPDKYITSDTCFKEWIKNAGDEFEMFVLPKKHGRLIDADILKSKMGDMVGFGILGRCFDDEPTVIDATKEEGGAE